MIGSAVAYYFFGQKNIINALAYAVIVFVALTAINMLTSAIALEVTISLIIFALAVPILVRYLVARYLFKQSHKRTITIVVAGIIIDIAIVLLLAAIIFLFLTPALFGAEMASVIMA